ncbi:CoF synthetase [Flavivirga spongiicola]|uniref:CoF synthetase n=1 Tax=Flavivirga spongiicola TaxID=421621 RepID=A0ABU7XXA2_9FLAO|nr:CoF synthetase [Flavivirga sp. MEBiC05379]MDO5980426.1 CoF synthetase [Flavivirga sp. MEBiC05379]
MHLLNYLRNKSFWVIDSLKGCNIRKHLDEISSVINSPNSSNSLNIRKQHLENLLKHAVNTTPFYKSYINASSIMDFPVIKKTIIQDNFEQFRSLPFKNKQNFKVSTSGSTGVPFFLFQDENKRNRNRADAIHFLKCCNFEIGNRLFYLVAQLEHNQKSKFIPWVQNVNPVDVSKLTDEKITEFLDMISKDQNPNKAILGHVSAFETIIQFLEKKNRKVDNIKLNSIIANSEYLSPQTKSTLNKYFNTHALSRYSSEEIGIMAHQTIDSPKNFVINHASYHIEVLNFENDNPVKPGELGRIVVTDLFNYAMPMIRYDTGDVAELITHDNGNMQFKQIEGRKMDLIYNSQGQIVSSFLANTKLYKYYALLKQYQFIQQGKKEYEIKLNLQGDTFPYENDLIEDVKKDFGKDANVTITYVDEIPPLASGKRRKVVNNYQKKQTSY